MPQEDEYELTDMENNVSDIEENLTIEEKIKNLSPEEKQELKLRLISLLLDEDKVEDAISIAEDMDWFKPNEKKEKYYVRVYFIRERRDKTIIG